MLRKHWFVLAEDGQRPAKRPWFLEGVGLAGSYTKVFLPQLVYTVVAKKHHLKKTNKNQQRYGVGTQNCFFLELRWASIYGVAQSRTRLRRLSSSSIQYIYIYIYILDIVKEVH